MDANLQLPNDLTTFFREIPGIHGTTDRRSAYLADQMFSKFVSNETDPPALREERAITKWLATEARNAETRDRIDNMPGEYNILPRVRYDTFIGKVQSIIRDLIGDTVPTNVLTSGSYSGGASTSRKRASSHPAEKYLGKAHVTLRAMQYLPVLASEQPLRLLNGGFDEVEVIEGNVMFMVPKNTEIDRAAAKEPDFNMYMQKSVGDYIRARLKGVGINLNDQSRNKDLARKGSITGTLATLDLSSASDSVSSRLVEEVLPICWWTYLSDLRSPFTLVKGEWHENEMFSSMGNGFTFELESLIFYAIARATAWSLGVPGVVSVYGDDIICPTEIAEPLMFALQVLGFQVNPDKSFWTGDFRESCGGHFISGRDVTPFYIKKPICTLLDLMHGLNSYRKWCDDGVVPGILDPVGEDLWSLLAAEVPKCFWGGHDYGDKTRLVSPRPDGRKRMKRLSQVTDRSETGLGGLLFWLDTRVTDSALIELGWERISTGPVLTPRETSEKSTDMETYKTSYVKWEQWTDAFFPKEVGT